MGRHKATGRFDSRDELEAFVWHEWRTTPRNQVEIARAARVGEGTVASILNQHPPTPEEKGDEVWVTKDGRHIPVGELQAEHARNIIRMILKDRRKRRPTIVALAEMVRRLIVGAEAREAELLQRLHDDIYNDVMEDRKWGSD
jgi:hypothetical protein